MIAVPIILALVAGYLIGSVMTAVKIAKKRNRDIRMWWEKASSRL